MIVQLLLDGLLTGSILALGAIGVTLGISILRFANFAYAEFLTVGAYATLAFVLAMGGTGAPLGPFSFGVVLIIALGISIMLTAVVTLAADRLVFAPLRRRDAGPLVMVFASFGLALIMRNFVLLLFGPAPQYYSSELQIAVRLGELRIMPDQIFLFAITIVTLVVLWWFLNHTRYGVAMRAVAENPVLAQTCSISPNATTRMTWVIVGVLCALGGTLFGLTVQIRPEMGASLLLPLFTAAVLGGVGSVPGAVIGGLVVGVAESLSTLIIPTAYKSAAPFVIMLACFFLRPTGLFGRGA